MRNYLPLIVAIVLMALLAWCRRGHGGVIGERIRRSDYLAWQDAVEEKDAELAALRQMEPRR